MPKFNVGIRTEAGQDLFGRVDSGQTSIHYTKIVYSSLDLSNKSDDEIAQMTDVNPKELIVPNPSVLYKPKTATTDPETEIRAIGSNEILQKGFYINTYALFASDDSGHEILLGVTLDDHPSWLPAYDGVRPQALTYNWDIGDKDSNNVKFTDANDAYATYADLQQYSSAIDYSMNQSASGMNNKLSSYNKNLISNASNVSDLSKSNSDLQQQITSNKNDISNSNAVNPSSYTFNNSTIDLNDCTDFGTYGFYESTVVNGPVGNNVHYFGYLYVTNNVSNTNYEFKDRIQLLFINQGGTSGTGVYIRTVNPNQQFGEWDHLINQDDLEGVSNQLANLKQSALQFIPAGGFLDLNNERFINQSGIYFFNAKLANAPKGISHGYGLLIVYFNGGMTVQQLYMADPDFSSFRIYDTRSFSDWHNTITEKNISDLQSQITNNYSNSLSTAKGFFNQSTAYTDSKVNAINQFVQYGTLSQPRWLGDEPALEELTHGGVYTFLLPPSQMCELIVFNDGANNILQKLYSKNEIEIRQKDANGNWSNWKVQNI